MCVICAKCGGTNVECEAIINPNDKSFKNYTEDSFYYGWCNDCGTYVVLTDIEEECKKIDSEFQDYISQNGHEPGYAYCGYVWKDDPNTILDSYIKLSCDVNEETDESVLFYCNSLNDFKSLFQAGSNDFIVVEFYSFRDL